MELGVPRGRRGRNRKRPEKKTAFRKTPFWCGSVAVTPGSLFLFRSLPTPTSAPSRHSQFNPFFSFSRSRSEELDQKRRARAASGSRPLVVARGLRRERGWRGSAHLEQARAVARVADQRRRQQVVVQVLADRRAPRTGVPVAELAERRRGGCADLVG